MPEFLADELADFLGSIPEERRACRIFCFTKSYLHHEMKRGCAACGSSPSGSTTFATATSRSS